MAQNQTGWAGFSDVRLKENVQPYGVLDKLDGYRTVSFDWKSTKYHDVGVIAQELVLLFPEVVDKGSDKGIVSKISDPGVWGVHYDKLGALALEGVKELKAYVDGDHAELTKLKADNDNQAAEIEGLRREIQALRAAR